MNFEQASEKLIQVGKELYNLGWAFATSTNYSIRCDDKLIAITVSGKHKGKLTIDDIMLIDAEGKPYKNNKKPSAETLLHTELYKRFNHVNAVLHTHSVNATVLSRLHHDDTITFEQYEMLKIFPGIDTHDTKLVIPIFDNDQDMTRLSKKVDSYLRENLYSQQLDSSAKSICPGYLIRGHGLYTWGTSMFEAMNQTECFEFLFSCALKERGFKA